MNDQIRSIAIGAALSAIGAVSIYVTQNVDALKAMGPWGYLAGMLVPVALNALRKYLESKNATPAA